MNNNFTTRCDKNAYTSVCCKAKIQRRVFILNSNRYIVNTFMKYN